MTRGCRHSEAGRDRNRQRKSRAGEERHPSGNYVRKVAPPTEAHDDDPTPHHAKPVSLPKLRFLERKVIAGEPI
jgi:hypothetical protein